MVVAIYRDAKHQGKYSVSSTMNQPLEGQLFYYLSDQLWIKMKNK